MTREEQAALEFAKSMPVRWDSFLEKWLKDHPEPAEEKKEEKTGVLKLLENLTEEEIREG